MNKRLAIIFLIIFCAFTPPHSYAQTTSAGFIREDIWYSKDPFTEGDKINIYTVIFDPDVRALTGTVDFFDQTTLIGKKTFTVASKRTQDISIEWTVTAGDHNIYAKIESAKFVNANGTYENAHLNDDQTSESKRTVKKAIIPKPSVSASTPAVDDQIQNIEKIIEDKTPEFISKPIAVGANALEDMRQSVGVRSEDQKIEVKGELQNIPSPKPNTSNSSSGALKPFKYVELFFMTLISFIFNHAVVFYIVLALLVWHVARFIWHLIF